MDSPLVTETWKAHIWEAGEDITADKLNTLEQQVAKITTPALGAIRYDVKQNISGEAVDNLRNNLDINIATTQDVGIIKAKQSTINYDAQTSDDLYEQSENSPSPCIANSIVSADGTLTVQVPLATYSQPGAVMIKGDSGLEFAREAEVIVDGSEITPGEEGEPQPGWLKVTQMKGATAENAGTAGIPPAPAAGDQLKYLRGDGTWDDLRTTMLAAFPVGYAPMDNGTWGSADGSVGLTIPSDVAMNVPPQVINVGWPSSNDSLCESFTLRFVFMGMIEYGTVTVDFMELLGHAFDGRGGSVQVDEDGIVISGMRYQRKLNLPMISGISIMCESSPKATTLIKLAYRQNPTMVISALESRIKALENA